MTAIANFRNQVMSPFWYGFKILVFISFVAFSLIVLIDGPNLRALVNNLDLTCGMLLAAILPASLFWLVSVGLISWCFPLTVFDEGLRGYDFWGRTLTMQWDAMTQAKSRNMAGLRFVCIDIEDSNRTLWIPKFLGDFDRFCELVKGQAGKTSPLYRELVA